MADISSITLPNGQSYNIKDNSAIHEPSTEGISGQLLKTDGSGGRSWASETDPVFLASAAASITSNDITNWNGKVNEPDQEGYNGQVLTTDGSGGRTWTFVPKGSSANNIQIPISAWGGSTSCSLQVAGKYIVPTSTIIVCPEDYYREAWDLFEIECTSCSDDVLYFSCSTIPDLAIYFKVIVLNV